MVAAAAGAVAAVVVVAIVTDIIAGSVRPVGGPYSLDFRGSRADGSGRREFMSSFLAMKEENIEIEGSIQTVLPGTMFRVELDNKHLVLATISGKMRKRWVRLTVGDRVKMEMSPYDMDKARIIWRLKDEPPPSATA